MALILFQIYFKGEVYKWIKNSRGEYVWILDVDWKPQFREFLTVATSQVRDKQHIWVQLIIHSISQKSQETTNDFWNW